MVYYLLMLVLGIVIAWFAAKEFYEIATMKGYPEKKYFWWCFFVGLVGWPMVIALPDRASKTYESSTVDTNELPDL